jgi:hypothetical protein
MQIKMVPIADLKQEEGASDSARSEDACGSI